MALEHLLNARVVEVGKIKLGTVGDPRPSKSGGTWRPPVKLDHFLVTTLNRDENERLVADAELMESLGAYCDPHDGKLRRIPVFCMSNAAEDVMTAAYVAYAGKQCAARSDGLTLTEFMDKPGGAWLKEPRTSPHTPDAIERWKMKLSTTLNVMIVSASARLSGVYKLRTTSRITADQLYGSIRTIQDLTGGILRGIPLWLVVRPVTVAPEGKPTVVYVCHLELTGKQLEAVREEALARMRFELENVREVKALQARYKALLAHDGDLDADEVAEFFPEALGASPAVVTDRHGEVIEPAVVGPATVPPPPAADAPPAPESYGNDKRRFAKLISRKGQDWPRVMTWLNLAFKTGYTRDAKWEDVPEEHRREAARQLLGMKDAEVKP